VRPPCDSRAVAPAAIAPIARSRRTTKSCPALIPQPSAATSTPIACRTLQSHKPRGRIASEGSQDLSPDRILGTADRPSARATSPHRVSLPHTIYGLAGVLTWTIEGTSTDVGPGEALFVPRGAVHQFDNTGDLDATALAIVTPGILGPDFFCEVAAILDAAAGGPPDHAALAAVMHKHGLTPAS
jgi:hypothetical protein